MQLLIISLFLLTPPPSSSIHSWFDSIVEFNANGGNVFGSWWNEFIELKPLSSSALLATDLMRSLPSVIASISFVGLYLSELLAFDRRFELLPLRTGSPLLRPSKWISSSVSVRTDDEFECTDPSLVLLLWYELWLSRDFNLRCNEAGPVNVWSPDDFRSFNEFRWNDWSDLDSLRIGSFRFSRFCAVRYNRNASWDNFSASSSLKPFWGDFFGDRRLLNSFENNNT